MRRLQFGSKRVWEPFPRDMLPADTRVLPCQRLYTQERTRWLNAAQSETRCLWKLRAEHGPEHLCCDIANAKSTRVLCSGCTTQATNTSYDVQGVYLSADVERGVLFSYNHCRTAWNDSSSSYRAMYGLVDSARAWQRRQHLSLKALASLAATRTNVYSR